MNRSNEISLLVHRPEQARHFIGERLRPNAAGSRAAWGPFSVRARPVPVMKKTSRPPSRWKRAITSVVIAS
jgi:hypothetical protein